MRNFLKNSQNFFQIQCHSELTVYVKKILNVAKKFLCPVKGSTVFGEAEQCTPCG